MELNLDQDEAQLIARVLRNHLGDLREEIYKTENFDWRQGLHEDEAIIKRLLSRLGQPVESVTGSTEASAAAPPPR
jgi:hypothetical protein